MTIDLTPDVLCLSARDFAQTALTARHSGKSRRMAVDAATCLEHLAKACLAARSPALLTEFRGGDENFKSLLQLVGVAGPPPNRLRTVGLREALERVQLLVKTRAIWDDVKLLVDMRDGAVHAAQGGQGVDEEDRVVVAFVRHADALLDDLGRDRAEFWEPQLAVVEALLSDVSDRAYRRIVVSLEAARAHYAARWGGLGAEVVEAARRLEAARDPGPQAMRHDCPACGSPGLVDGHFEVEWALGRDESRRQDALKGTVLFYSSLFECRMCDLELSSIDEFEITGFGWPLEVESADPAEYDPWPDTDAEYDRWREERRSD